MAITGTRKAGRPARAFAVCDLLSGSTAASACPARCSSARIQAKKGQLVEVSMLEATLAFLSGQVRITVAGHSPSNNPAIRR